MSDVVEPTPHRLQGLVDAVIAMSSELSLEVLLERIAYIASSLIGSRYAALGVLEASSNRRLGTFANHGMTDEQKVLIGPMPEGHGILGLLIDHPTPIRLNPLSDHSESFGFPANHPPMTSFLGVPIRIHDQVFGNLYLTEKLDPGGFTPEDEELATALASAASVVIENTRLYEQADRHRRWLATSAELTTALLGPISYDAALQLVVDSAREVAGADFAAVIIPDDDAQYVVRGVSGVPPEGVVSEVVEVDDTVIGDVVRSRELQVVPDADAESHYHHDKTPRWPHLSTVMILPLHSGDLTGAIVTGWHAPNRAVATIDPVLPMNFAEQAALALQVAEARESQARLAVYEDRDRIGRDLHDLVIQRLFAIGLTLDHTVKDLPDDETAERITAAIDDIDSTIKDIRRTIFALSTPSDSDRLRMDIENLVAHATLLLGFRPRLDLRGPVDTVVDDTVRGHLLAVVGETLSNVVRHSGAKNVEVLVDVVGSVKVVVTDDGRGLADQVPGNGLRNMRHRAELLGGRFEVRARAEGGLVAYWEVPLRQRAAVDPERGRMEA